MLGSSFVDQVLGIDVHLELVPTPAPTPTPIPNPFVGMVYDPIGLAAGLAIGAAVSAVTGGPPLGPVMCWTAFPASNTGTEAKGIPGHILIPPGVSWAPFPKTPKPLIRAGDKPKPALPVKPEDDAISIFGSKTVTVMGSNFVRLGDISLSCSEPARLPASVVLAVPKGAPILVGGPPSLDLLAAAMGAIRTRFVGDSVQALLSRMRPGRLRSFLQRAACFFTGHPVDVATGKVMTAAVDAELAGPLPLQIERVYTSSFASRKSPMGNGWSLSLDQAVWEERGKVVYLAADGRELEFDTFDLPNHRIRPGDEVRHPFDRLTLRRLENDEWRITTHDGIRYEFAPVSGTNNHRSRIRRMSSRCGFHEILYSYDKRGRLEWVRDSAGRLIQLEHDSHDRVTALKLPLSRGRGWYAHRRYEYDSEGDLRRITDSKGNSWSFEYVTHLLTRESDREGFSFNFQYDGLGEDAWCVRTWGDGGVYDHKILYDKVGHKTFVTNSLGDTTIYEMNIIGQVVGVTDPLGNTSKYVYCDGTGQVLSETDPLGGKTVRKYDQQGNLSSTTTADGAVMNVSYDQRFDLPTRLRDALGREWSWVYNRLGQLTALRDPAGGVVKYTWNDDGMLQCVVAPGDRTIDFRYDAEKNVEAMELPDGTKMGYRHDRLGRVMKTIDAQGGVRRIEYDTESCFVQVSSLTGVIQEMRWDREGNLVECWDRNRHLKFGYGHYHRLVQREEDGTRIIFEYNTEDQLTGARNELGERYIFELDANGRTRAETGFDGFTRSYKRDALGRLIEATLPSGRKTVFSYDAVGRVEQMKHSDETGSSFEWDEVGRLRRASSESSETIFEWDSLDRIVAESQDGGHHWIRSDFGPGGERISMRSDSGAQQLIEISKLGNVTALTQGELISGSRPQSRIGFARNPLGLEVERHLPGGIDVSWQRDAAGRPLKRQVTRRHGLPGKPLGPTKSVDVRGYEWRGKEQISAIAGAAVGSVFYDHDARGRLIRERRPEQGRVIERAMDAAGNVYSSPDRTDRWYGEGGRLREADGIRYEHDDDGNLTLRAGPNQQDWRRYHWNGSGKLAAVEAPDGVQVRFAYDAFARRTSKQVVRVGEDGAETVEMERRFVWDGATVVHELDSQDGLTTWYWEPGTFTPVMKEQGGKRYSIISDHLGTPTEMYDEAGELAWRMQLDVFGVAQFDAGDAHECPWRWPGQYEDTETGDYYNRFRYFRPGEGTYSSADPLRFEGNLNSYAYPDDPSVWGDPLGLVTYWLEQAMAADNRPIGPGQTAHHIVQREGGGAAGDRARAVVDRHLSAPQGPRGAGQPVDHAANGARLWGTGPEQVTQPGHPGRGTSGNRPPGYHAGNGIHGNRAIQRIANILERAERMGMDIENVLRQIGRRQETGKWCS